MGIVSRVSELVQANVHALLDRVEDPEVMAAQIIREMEHGLLAARRAAALAIAAERRLGRELEENRQAALQWRTRAREALAAGREDLARRALLRKQEHDALVGELERQTAAATAASEQMRGTLRALETRLAAARRKQRSLQARHQAARVRLQAKRTSARGMWESNEGDASFRRWESRLTALEEELSAEAELLGLTDRLEQEFEALQAEQAMERGLADLRRDLPTN